jgi:uncharacterized protein YegP (UPF0339 family)
MGRGKFEKFTGKNGQFYWRLKASNGQVVCQSEGYTRKHNRDRAIDRLAEIAFAAEVVEA